MPRTLRPLARWVMLATVLFGAAFLGGAGLFFGLRAALGRTPIAYSYRMFMYPDQHPLSYLAVLSLCYSIWAAAWTVRRRQPLGWIAIAGIWVGSVLTAAPLCGLLWELHDMQAGWFPPPDIMRQHFCDGIIASVKLAPMIVFFSFPLNLLALAFTGLLARAASRRYWYAGAQPRTKPSSP